MSVLEAFKSIGAFNGCPDSGIQTPRLIGNDVPQAHPAEFLPQQVDALVTVMMMNWKI
jgi:hypothetical protein